MEERASYTPLTQKSTSDDNFQRKEIKNNDVYLEQREEKYWAKEKLLQPQGKTDLIQMSEQWACNAAQKQPAF